LLTLVSHENIVKNKKGTKLPKIETNQQSSELPGTYSGAALELATGRQGVDIPSESRYVPSLAKKTFGSEGFVRSLSGRFALHR
jgi:hypothetical protein